MRKFLLMLFLLTLIGEVSIVQCQETAINFRDPETWLLGYFSPDDLLRPPHDTWYDNEFDAYEVDKEAFLELTEMDLSDIEVIVVMGTWCPDSRREVPRFMKLCQLTGLNQDKIKMIGTDSYKEAPIDSYKELDIERVPTFIFYFNKNEVGRIIEYPVSSLERDMVNIFKELEHIKK